MKTAAEMLSERALQVVLKIRVWSGNKSDKRLKKDLETQTGAQSKKAIRVNKSLLPDSTWLKQVKHIATRARQYNYSVTRAWNDDGARILPTQLFTKHRQKMEEYQTEFEEAVERFLDGYHESIKRASADLGFAFREEDYPDTGKLKGKFSFELQHIPIPTSGDFRVGVTQSQMEEIKAQLERSAEEAALKSRKQLYERLHNLVDHMYNKLSDPKGKFKNTLTANISSLSLIMRDLNIEGDQTLNSLADEAHTLTLQKPQTLREDMDVRAATAARAKEVSSKIATQIERLNS